MAKKEKELTQADGLILHTLFEHIASIALPQFGIAMMELKEIDTLTGDKRASKVLKVLEDSLVTVTEAVRAALEPIPGVVIPTPEELKKMIVEAKAEQEFMTIIQDDLASQEKLH